jgi:hypothetical protein
MHGINNFSKPSRVIFHCQIWSKLYHPRSYSYRGCESPTAVPGVLHLAKNLGPDSKQAEAIKFCGADGLEMQNHVL